VEDALEIVGLLNQHGPVGKAAHNDLLDIFFDGQHDMRVVERISVKI